MMEVVRLILTNCTVFQVLICYVFLQEPRLCIVKREGERLINFLLPKTFSSGGLALIFGVVIFAGLEAFKARGS